MTSSPRSPAPGDPVDDPHDDAKDAPATTRLSLTQVVASALAAVSATVLMSFFGVAGTIIGAGLASVVTVIGNFLYTRSIEKTHEQLKPVVTKVVARTGPASARSRTVAMRVSGTATTARGTVVSTSDAADAPVGGDGATTVERRSVTETLADGTVPGTQPLDATAPLDETRPLGPVGAAGAALASEDGDGSDGEVPDGDAPEGEEPEPRNAWLRFVEKHGTKKVLALSAAALFVVVMGVVLVVELVIGKPLSDAVRGQEGSGTSISRTSRDADDSTTVPTPTSPAEDPANIPGDDSGTGTGDRGTDESTTGTTDGSTDEPTDGSTPDSTTGTDPDTDTPTDGSTGGTDDGTDGGTDTGTDGSDDGTTGDGTDTTGGTGGTSEGGDAGTDTGTGTTVPDAEQGTGSTSGSAQDGAATPTPTPAS
ncbi:hypothetical protein ACQP60_12275 [Isoptericola variabilis]|uniref:hypothetical protein n=1 Tax=Isoptericola variabilis TaxID=139208 RepID=UPI003D224CEC